MPSACIRRRRRTRAGPTRARHRRCAALTPDCDGAKIKAYNHRVCCTKVPALVAPENVADLAKVISCVAPRTRGRQFAHLQRADLYGRRRHQRRQFQPDSRSATDRAPRSGSTSTPVCGCRISTRWLYERGWSIGYTMIGFRGITDRRRAGDGGARQLAEISVGVELSSRLGPICRRRRAASRPAPAGASAGRRQAGRARRRAPRVARARRQRRHARRGHARRPRGRAPLQPRRAPPTS